MGKISLSKGRASIAFDNPVIIKGSASVVGHMENDGPLSGCFDKVCEDKDDMFGEDSWEKAESALQRETISLSLQKTGIRSADIKYLFTGDLLGQNIASSFGVMDYDMPMFGLYGACSTCGEGLGLGAMAVAGGFAERVLCITSSHFASAQKEFRFPLEYGGQRPLYASWTVTAGAGFVLESHDANPVEGAKNIYKKKIGITGITTGRIEDFGIRDSFNMGCAMAPAARWTIKTNLEDFNIGPDAYDAIITGDLGNVGREALLNLLEKDGIDIRNRHYDCGLIIYDLEKQDVHAGGSGCGCSAAVLSAYILGKLDNGEWKRVLFVPTGALLNKTSFNEGQNVAGIAHGVVIESL